MTGKLLIVLSVLIALAIFLSGCSDNSLELKEAEVKQILHSKISVGDSQEKVEAVLKNIDIDFLYDEYSNRYYTTIRDERWGSFQALSVYIAFDESGKVSEIKVFKSYTMP